MTARPRLVLLRMRVPQFQTKKVHTLDMVKCYLTDVVLCVAEYIKKPWAHVIRGFLNEEDVAACKEFLLAEQDATFPHSESFSESHMLN
jgi:hypothetical protein